LLHHYINEEIAAQGANPRREMAKLRARCKEIDEKASVLLEGVSPDTKGFIDAKLRELAREKRRIQSQLHELESTPLKSIDPASVLKHGMEAIRDLPRLLESGKIEERKEFVRSFIEGIVVQPDKLRLDLQIRKIPALEPGNSTCLMVAGARYEAVQIDLEATSHLVVGGKHLRFVA
jgi:hypothetical protein